MKSTHPDLGAGPGCALRLDQAHRRRVRERLNRVWDVVQSRSRADFEWRSARPPLTPNGPREQEDARP